jgi:Uma2 family endonuclease
VRQERIGIFSESRLLEAPDLVVEIISASTARYDRGPKLANYARAGVTEMWLMDPYGPLGTQFFQRASHELLEVAPVDGVLESIAMPNFKLQTAWLWPNEQDELPSMIDVLKELGVL